MGVVSMKASELSVPSNGRIQLLETAGADTNNENENEALRFESRASVPTVSSKEMAMNLITGGLGTGMLSLPWAMAGASVLVGVVTILLVIVVNLWTIMILVEAAERYQVFDLAAVLGKLPGRLGPSMQVLTNIMVWVALFGSLISYIIAMCDSAGPFVKGTLLEHRPLLAGLASAIVLPLCFVNQRYLSFTSSLAVLVNVYLISLVAFVFMKYMADDTLPTGSCAFGLAKGSVTMLSTMMQCVIIQMCVLPMYQELENRSPRKFSRILWFSFSVLALLFGLLSSAGYLAFGPNVNSNMLVNLPKNVAGDIAQFGMLIVLAAVYPIMMIAMIAPIKNLSLETFSSVPAIARRRHQALVTVSTVGLVLGSFLVAVKVTDLGIINVIDGALCVGVFTGLVPGSVGLFLSENKSAAWKASMILLIVAGLVGSVLGIVFMDNSPDLLALKCRMLGSSYER